MNKILEALKNLLPSEQLTEVAGAVDGMLAEAKAELEAEFQSKLEEAYADASGEITKAEKIAETGYEEAYGIITDLRNRLEKQKEEFEQTLEEGYEEAYQLLLGERGKNDNKEVDIYDEYDKKLSEMKEYIVDKVDMFLQQKGAEIYEQAKRDVINDPRMAEHKVALDKIVDITANYLSGEEMAFATSNKLEERMKQLEELKGQMKIMEARNIRLSSQNTKLNENLRHQGDLLNEAKQYERKERSQKAKNVSGRGTSHSGKTEVIAEYNEEVSGNREDDTTLVESLGYDRNTLQTLAGTIKNK